MWQVMELDRWARQVRQTTRAEIRRLRQQRAAAMRQQAGANGWALFLKRMTSFGYVLRGGAPAIERRVMRWINPQIDPENLLPHPAPHQQSSI